MGNLIKVFPIVDNSPDEVITFVDGCFREEVRALIDSGRHDARLGVRCLGTALAKAAASCRTPGRRSIQTDIDAMILRFRGKKFKVCPGLMLCARWNGMTRSIVLAEAQFASISPGHLNQVFLTTFPFIDEVRDNAQPLVQTPAAE